MDVVIKISEREWKEIINDKDGIFRGRYFDMIREGTILPKGHGRLIDADALWKKWVFDTIGKQEIDGAPTIIEADAESEE